MAATGMDGCSGLEMNAGVDEDGLALLSEATIPIAIRGTEEPLGNMRLQVYQHGPSRSKFCAIIAGAIQGRRRVLTRVHDACFTSEVLGSCKCDCKSQLEHAQRQIAQEASNGSGGLIVYTFQEGRNIGLANKIAAYNLQESRGMDTVDANLALGLPAENRFYDFVPPVLARLDVRSILLMSNNPFKLRTLKGLGVVVEGRSDASIASDKLASPARAYLQTKVKRMGHQVSTIGNEADVQNIVPTDSTAMVAKTAVANMPNGMRAIDDEVSSIDWLISRTQALKASFHNEASHLAPSRKYQSSRLPFVTLSYAQSIDGSIARPAENISTNASLAGTTSRRAPLVLSGRPAMTLTHALRAAHDAILVGVGTVVADDPRLTVRLVEGNDPLPVVLDGSLRIPLDCKLVSQAAARAKSTKQASSAMKASNKGIFLIILTTEWGRQQPSFSTLSAIPGVAVEIISGCLDSVCESDSSSSKIELSTLHPVSLPRALMVLREDYNIGSVMVEGGAKVISSFLFFKDKERLVRKASATLVDNVVITVSPMLVGGLSAVKKPFQPAEHSDGDFSKSSFPSLTTHGNFSLGLDTIIFGCITVAGSLDNHSAKNGYSTAEGAITKPQSRL